MKKTSIIYGWIATAFISPLQESTAQETPNSIQEEESAEVFLEEYTDEFQDTFFEALKQKGIQNYDRAINLLLECKQLQPENTTLDHELAKVYLLDNKYVPAQQYAIEALIASPDNYWFLENLAAIANKQGIPIQSLKNVIPYQNEALRDNLARLYFKEGNYSGAKEILGNLAMTQERTLLLQKVNDSLSQRGKAKKNTGATAISVEEDSPENPLDGLREELEKLVQTSDIQTLASKSEAAVEQYPLQPSFYYYRGLALVQLKDYAGAISVLEEGLDYVFDNEGLSNKIYKQLAEAHSALGNSFKANEYLSKVKSGF